VAGASKPLSTRKGPPENKTRVKTGLDENVSVPSRSGPALPIEFFPELEEERDELLRQFFEGHIDEFGQARLRELMAQPQIRSRDSVSIKMDGRGLLGASVMRAKKI